MFHVGHCKISLAESLKLKTYQILFLSVDITKLFLLHPYHYEVKLVSETL
jgi:hypothetical protein